MTVKKAEKYFAFIGLVVSLVAPVAGQFDLLTWSAVRGLWVANLLLYLLTLFLFRRTYKSFADPNPQVSIRAIMSGFMIKFFVLASTALLYIFYLRKEVSIPILAGSAVLYILYTAAEISALLRLLKSPDHA